MNQKLGALDLLDTARCATALPCACLPLIEELIPAPDPWDVCRRLAHLPHLLFLDSAGGPARLSRYSYVTAQPFGWLHARGRDIRLNGRKAEATDPFPVLAGLLARYRTIPCGALPPFQGGAGGLFGYDLCHHLERLPRPRFDEFAIPDLMVGFYDWVVAFDHVAQRAWIVSTGLPEAVPERQRRRAATRLQVLQRLLREPAPRDFDSGPVGGHFALRLDRACALPNKADLFSSFDRAGYLAAVRRAIEYIHAGDCYQVNLSQRLLHSAPPAPLDLYRRLRERNPAPFAGYFDGGDFVVASASPERFLRVENSQVEARPIKGTRPRGATLAEDKTQIVDLQASAKDRAENIMIVDLIRNDLGRVCRYGSVRVPAVCGVESYPTVHHLVSEIRGELRDGLGPVDLLRAAFPGGSVTGAPKIRAMEIIAELEPTARGPYCGSMGYIGFDGSMDLSILIRTFTVGKGWVQFPVGGGIVADSVPEREYEETWHKAEGLLRAFD
jgi:para-aminobenzoate synthetase component I